MQSQYPPTNCLNDCEVQESTIHKNEMVSRKFLYSRQLNSIHNHFRGSVICFPLFQYLLFWQYTYNGNSAQATGWSWEIFSRQIVACRGFLLRLKSLASSCLACGKQHLRKELSVRARYACCPFNKNSIRKTVIMRNSLRAS